MGSWEYLACAWTVLHSCLVLAKVWGFPSLSPRSRQSWDPQLERKIGPRRDAWGRLESRVGLAHLFVHCGQH